MTSEFITLARVLKTQGRHGEVAVEVHSDLIGCTVFDGDRELGNIGEVRFGAGEAPLLVVKAGSKEYEIPYAEAYLQQVDLSHKQIRMSLPEGLLEVNAPLTAEEKLAQRAPLRTKTK